MRSLIAAMTISVTLAGLAGVLFAQAFADGDLLLTLLGFASAGGTVVAALAAVLLAERHAAQAYRDALGDRTAYPDRSRTHA